MARTMYLREIAEIKRAKKGKIYKKGTILIGLSATRGEVKYLDYSQEVPTKMATVEVNNEHNSYYVYQSIMFAFPKFYAEWKTGINIQIDKLDYLKIYVHERKMQYQIAKLAAELERVMEFSEKGEQFLKNMKKWYLDKMFL